MVPGRQTICTPRQLSGQRECSGSHSLRVFIALPSLFSSQQARGIPFGNALASCDLRLNILQLLTTFCAMSRLIFSFFLHSFMSTSLHQVPHKPLSQLGYASYRWVQTLRGCHRPRQWTQEGHSPIKYLSFMCWATPWKNSSTAQQWVAPKCKEREDVESARRSLQRAVGPVRAAWISDKATSVLGSGGLAVAQCQVWYQVSETLRTVLSLYPSPSLTIASDRCPQMWVAAQLSRISRTSEGAGTGC